MPSLENWGGRLNMCVLIFCISTYVLCIHTYTFLYNVGIEVVVHTCAVVASVGIGTGLCIISHALFITLVNICIR